MIVARIKGVNCILHVYHLGIPNATSTHWRIVSFEGNETGRIAEGTSILRYLFSHLKFSFNPSHNFIINGDYDKLLYCFEKCKPPIR